MIHAINKWANELIKQFSEEVQMANRHTKKCPASFAIKRMQIKTTLRFHFTSIRMAVFKKTTTNAGRGVGKKEPSHTVGGNVN
jgi:hypothetical protein